MKLLVSIICLCCLAACAMPRPQRGGSGTTSLGGTQSATTSHFQAPENPQTPSTTTVEKETEREYLSPKFTPTHTSSGERGFQPTPSPDTPFTTNTRAVDEEAGQSEPRLLRERTKERATTMVGAAQKDTARELGARLANTRGIMWVGVLLLIGGPVIGWKLGWLTNGLIAGGAGLLLIVLATVIPGNEAWLGLGLLVVLPVVAYAYYKGHHDKAEAASVFRTTPPSS